ncbi:hypothetical protein HY971_03395 [Candidatus Kaiserbacteria bacterium]|nr:hypothetical protein [Candidatus Kaiserbacteria bacterium]
MGKMEEETRKRRKKENIQKAVLATVAVTGTLAVAMLAPNIFSALPGIMGKKRYKLAFQARTAASRLAIKGYVRFVEKNGKKRMEITEAGRRAIALEEQKAALAAQQGKRWDKRWRLVMFDIPQQRRQDRDHLRSEMRACGFLRLQDSVWVFPYDCEDLIVLLKADMRIGKDILYAIVESIENDGWIKKHFGLSK